MSGYHFLLTLLLAGGIAVQASAGEPPVKGVRVTSAVASAGGQHNDNDVQRLAPTKDRSGNHFPMSTLPNGDRLGAGRNRTDGYFSNDPHPAVTSHPQAETLEQAWARAVAFDQQLQARQWEVGSAQELVSLARAERKPMLAFHSAYTVRDNEPGFLVSPNGFLTANVFPTNQREDFSFQATVDMPLYTSGRIRHQIAAAQARLRSTEFEVETYHSDLLLKVAEEYIAVLRAERDLAVARSNVQSLTSHLRDVNMLYEHQRVPRSDLLAAEVARSNAIQQQIQVLHQLDATRSAYNRRLGRPLNAEFQLAGLGAPMVSADLDELMVRATARRPELATLATEVQSLHEEAASLLAGNLPQVGAHGDYAFQENRFRSPEGIAAVGVGVDWNLWDGGKNRHKANSLLQRAESLCRIRADLESRIHLEVRQAWLSYQEAQRRIEVTREAVRHAEENLRINHKRYEFGTGTNTEVLDAVIRRAVTDRNYYHANYDAVFAVLRLRRAAGDL